MIVVVMGVEGTGKSTIGERLAASLDLPFIEGDDFHSAANIEKMGTACRSRPRIVHRWCSRPAQP